MTLGQPRLIVASATALVLIASTGLVGWSQLRTTSRAYEALVDQDARLTKDALEMRVAVDEQAAAVRGYLLSRGDAQFLAPYRAGRKTFRREVQEARAKIDDEAELRRLDEIARRYGDLAPVYQREVALAERGRFATAVRLAQESGVEQRERLVSTLDALISAEAGELYRGREEISSVERTAELAILGVLALALAAGTVAAVLAVRALRRQQDASAAIESARRAATEEAAVARIATAIAHEQEPRAVLGSAAGEAARLLGARSAAILRFEPGDRAGLVLGAAGAGVEAGQRMPIGCEQVTGGPVGNERTVGFGGASDMHGSLGAAGSGAQLAVPIRVGTETWGAVWVAFAPGEPLPPDAGDRLVRFAELASASIAGADARAHLAQLALEDSLTGLANHRHFHERLRAEVARAQRHGRELSVVLFDIDHFKDVNDSHGHQVGDLVLRETADRLAACAREGELIARVGGEQFGWILPEAGGLDAYQAAERARRAIGATPMPHGIAVTVSAGVCDLEHANSGSELLRFADGALFWAKAHGRDITFRYSPDVVTELSADEQLEHLRRTRTIVGIRALARAVDVKDRSTARHSERVAELAVALARALGWDTRRVSRLHEAALVHDVGKIGVPDAILLKPSPLDPDEYEAIKQHAALSAEIVNDVLAEEQVSWVLGHHERFDGRGYPMGLAGAEIPVGARILAMADAWDVMTSERPYSPARTKEDALEEVRGQSTRQFCPDVVHALEMVVSEDNPAGLQADFSM